MDINFSQPFVKWARLPGFPYPQYSTLWFLSYLHHLHRLCIWLKLPHFLTFFFLEIDFKRKLDRITVNGNHYHLPEQEAAIKVNTTKRTMLLIMSGKCCLLRPGCLRLAVPEARRFVSVLNKDSPAPTWDLPLTHQKRLKETLKGNNFSLQNLMLMS